MLPILRVPTALIRVAYPRLENGMTRLGRAGAKATLPEVAEWATWYHYCWVVEESQIASEILAHLDVMTDCGFAVYAIDGIGKVVVPHRPGKNVFTMWGNVRRALEDRKRVAPVLSKIAEFAEKDYL